MKRGLVRASVIAVGSLAVVLFALVTLNSLAWVGKPFPGFFVMANRVVPSVALPQWAEGRAARFFQHEVVSVDGRPVADADEVYEHVGTVGPERPVHYELLGSDGTRDAVAVTPRTFSPSDYGLIFGAFLLNGFVFVGTGILVFLLQPKLPASVALLSAWVSTGVFVITAADLYGPHWFFRLHVIAESLMSAGFLHLALVFPTDRIRRRKAVLLAIYLPFVVLAAVYEMVLFSPRGYTTVHLVATAAQGLGALAVIASVVHGFVTTGSVLVRRRIGVVAAGAVIGLMLPAALMAASPWLGGSVPLNGAALTAFLFPLSVGYAVVKNDLFEIDLMLRRAITYTVVVIAIIVLYVAAFSLIGVVVGGRSAQEVSPALFVLLNVGLLLAMAPIRSRVQESVDRIFFRRNYDPQKTVSDLSAALSSSHNRREVAASALRVLRETFFPQRLSMLERGADGGYRVLAGDEEGREVTLPGSLSRRLAIGKVATRYEWDDATTRAAPEIWQDLGADVLVPVPYGESTEAIFALGRKESGLAYTVQDAELLSTLAGQVTLALGTSDAFGELEALNASLEQQVRTRTRELATANQEISESLDKLRAAYAQLERSQEILIRADRLATLGRLIAGIAHEVNTPLGAVMNALETLRRLGCEYHDSVGDQDISEADHREIADEIVATASAASEWARKAAHFISRVKGHGREPRASLAEPFLVAGVVDETRALLMHRLHASGYRLEVSELQPGITTTGDPARLVHALVNLVSNAIDAYDEQVDPDGRISIEIERLASGVALTVRDWAGGVPPEVAPRIFEELFTTKEPGKGTGLGLWIARNVVEQGFGGQLTLEDAAGYGALFRITLPDRPAEAQGDGAPLLSGF